MQNLFSYPIKIDDLNSNEKKYSIKANENDLLYLAEVLKVPAVKNFAAEIKLKLNIKEHSLNVWGHAKAKLELLSVISLENFTKNYEAGFNIVYDTKATYKDISEMDADKDIDVDIPDIIINGKIDLADIAIEQIALIMEDYPRKEGEKFNFNHDFDKKEPVKKNPFEILAKLKK